MSESAGIVHRLKQIIETDGIKKIQDAITLVAGTEVDITNRLERELGKVSPSLAREYNRKETRDANGRVTQIVITDGVRTKTMAITRDVNGRITAINETVV